MCADGLAFLEGTNALGCSSLVNQQVADRLAMHKLRFDMFQDMTLASKGYHGQRNIERHPPEFAVLVVKRDVRRRVDQSNEDRQHADCIAVSLVKLLTETRRV